MVVIRPLCLSSNIGHIAGHPSDPRTLSPDDRMNNPTSRDVPARTRPTFTCGG